MHLQDLVSDPSWRGEVVFGLHGAGRLIRFHGGVASPMVAVLARPENLPRSHDAGWTDVASGLDAEGVGGLLFDSVREGGLGDMDLNERVGGDCHLPMLPRALTSHGAARCGPE